MIPISKRILVSSALVGLISAAGATNAFAQSICDAVAGNLVTNCGFETGDETGWTLSGNGGFNFVTGNPVHSGNDSWFDGAVGSLGILSQTITTVASQSYDFSFWYHPDGGTPNELFASFAGTTVLDAINSPAAGGDGWVQYDFTATAVSNSTVIALGIRQDPSESAIDDIVVTSDVSSTPEPASLVLLGTGLVGVFGVVRRRRK